MLDPLLGLPTPLLFMRQKRLLGIWNRNTVELWVLVLMPLTCCCPWQCPPLPWRGGDTGRTACSPGWKDLSAHPGVGGMRFGRQRPVLPVQVRG